MTTPVFDAYQIELQKRGYTSDPAQLAAVAELERCAAEWSTYKAKRSNALKKMLFHPDIPKGVYMYGGVGRGKSFLMDCFYNAVPIKRKTRLHFHVFMREVHRVLADLQGTENPLTVLGARIAKKFKLIWRQKISWLRKLMLNYPKQKQIAHHYHHHYLNQ